MPKSPVPELSRATADRWRKKVEGVAKRYDLPGLGVAVAHRGRPIWSAGVGFADVGTRRAARPDSVFRLASITKLFTATATLMLAQEGRLQVDDPVRKHVGEFPDRRITI